MNRTEKGTGLYENGSLVLKRGAGILGKLTKVFYKKLNGTTGVIINKYSEQFNLTKELNIITQSILTDFDTPIDDNRFLIASTTTSEIK